MSEKKERKMSHKGFLQKSTSKAAARSAWGFLSQYRDYLTKGELSAKTSPIMAKLDEERAKALAEKRDCEILAKTSLKEIQNAVMTHIFEADAKKLEQKQDDAQTASRGSKKPWIATIFDGKGNICTRVKDNGDEEDLVKGFDKSSDADRWVDRRLFEGASDWYGMVDHASLSVHTRTEREDAIARILKRPKGPTVQVRGISIKTLGFQHKAKDFRPQFSRG